jgi:hypothetical protein
MSQLPSGTVTFLFTDIEGSTQLWQQYPEAMPDALAQAKCAIQSMPSCPTCDTINACKPYTMKS